MGSAWVLTEDSVRAEPVNRMAAHQWRKRPNGSGTLNLGVTIIYSSTLFQGIYCVNWKPPDFEWGLEAKRLCSKYRVQCMLPCHLGLGTCGHTVLEISVLDRCWIKHLANSHRRTTLQTLSTLELGYVLLAFFIWQLYSSWKAASALLTGHKKKLNTWLQGTKYLCNLNHLLCTWCCTFTNHKIGTFSAVTAL